MQKNSVQIKQLCHLVSGQDREVPNYGNKGGEDLTLQEYLGFTDEETEYISDLQ